MRTIIIDGQSFAGTKAAAASLEVTAAALSASIQSKERVVGLGNVFDYKGRKIQCFHGGKDFAPKPYDGSITRIVEGEEKNLSYLDILDAVKEELRLTRDIIVQGIHRIDTLGECVRSLEKRLIKKEEKKHGVYHSDSDHQAERIG
jgi:hypothetical protein